MLISDYSDLKSSGTNDQSASLKNRVRYYVLTFILLLPDYHVTLHGVANPGGYIIAQLSRDKS